MTKKCKRTWSFEKFSAACKGRAKRLKVQIKASGLQKAYDDGLTIPYTVETLTTKTPAKATPKKAPAKKAPRIVEAAAPAPA